MRLSDIISYELLTGTTASIDSMRVTPQSQVLSVRWPGGGLVWNRPVAVLVEKNGQVSRIPILNITRIAQIGFMAVSLAVGFVALVMRIARWIER